jgi:hypothetical protein
MMILTYLDYASIAHSTLYMGSLESKSNGIIGPPADAPAGVSSNARILVVGPAGIGYDVRAVFAKLFEAHSSYREDWEVQHTFFFCINYHTSYKHCLREKCIISLLCLVSRCRISSFSRLCWWSRVLVVGVLEG